MSDILANDLRTQYNYAFGTIQGILEAFPEGRWREPHGDPYYIPCRIAYHVAVVMDGLIAGGFKDPNFAQPYGNWMESKAGDLPDKKGFLTYFDGVLSRTKKALEKLNDEHLLSPLEPVWAKMGASQMAVHLFLLRELSDHTGEMNKMLVEDGGEDVWM